MGQLFHFFESPNRFGLPPFYTLHVWAWKDNPNGTFTNWNPDVSCDAFNPERSLRSRAAPSLAVRRRPRGFRNGLLLLMKRRVGRLIAPPVEVMGWCRLPDWGASDAVRVHSKQGAIRRHSGCPLAVPYAGASDRLLDSSHGAFYRRDFVNEGARRGTRRDSSGRHSVGRARAGRRGRAPVDGVSLLHEASDRGKHSGGACSCL